MQSTRLTIALLLTSALASGQQEDSDLRSALENYPYRLLFETERDGNWELYTMAADGSDPVNLTNTEDIHEVYGKVSPDGQWIAYCADTETDGKRRRDVYCMRADGSERRKVAEAARDPFWSPDSSQLAFLPDEFKRFSFETWSTRGLRFHSMATGETRDHPNKEIEHLYTPTWSENGRWIVATVHGGMGFAHSIIAVSADGDDVYNLRLMGCRADLAPDGQMISWGLGDYALGVAELDLEDEPRVVIRDGQAVQNNRRQGQTYHVDWSPDSRYLAYSSGPRDRSRRLWSTVTPQCPGVTAKGWDIWVADADERNVRIQLTHDGKSNKEPDWIPTAANKPPTDEPDK